MASLFKPQIVRYLDANGKRVKKGTPGARRVKVQARKWWAEYRDGAGDLRRVPLCADRAAAQQLLGDLVKKASRDQVNPDPFEEHRKRPLTEHLADFRRALEARDNEPRYVKLVFSRLSALLEGCGFKLMADQALRATGTDGSNSGPQKGEMVAGASAGTGREGSEPVGSDGEEKDKGDSAQVQTESAPDACCRQVPVAVGSRGPSRIRTGDGGFAIRSHQDTRFCPANGFRRRRLTVCTPVCTGGE